MQDGKHCPACGVDIGVWPIFSAGMPSRIRCPNCRANFAYQNVWDVIVVLLLVATVIAVAGYFIARSFDENWRLLIFIAIMGAAWVPVELLVAWYLRENKVLEYRSGGVPPTP